MGHANARLTHFGRLLLVQRIIKLGWPAARAAESLGVSRATAYKWLARYRQHGPAGLADRSSRNGEPVKQAGQRRDAIRRAKLATGRVASRACH